MALYDSGIRDSFWGSLQAASHCFCLYCRVISNQWFLRTIVPCEASERIIVVQGCSYSWMFEYPGLLWDMPTEIFAYVLCWFAIENSNGGSAPNSVSGPNPSCFGLQVQSDYMFPIFACTNRGSGSPVSVWLLLQGFWSASTFSLSEGCRKLNRTSELFRGLPLSKRLFGSSSCRVLVEAKIS